MMSVEISGIGEFTGQEVLLKGWVYNMRSSGKILFLQMRDGTGVIQCIIEKAVVGDEDFELASGLTQESSFEVTGTVREDARAPGGYELSVTGFSIIQIAEPYPITPKDHGNTFLMDNRHLWLRSRRQNAILRIRAGLIRFIRDFYDNRGFILCDTPIFTPSACEGTTTLFETDYFGDKAYLTQSGQLYNEATAAAFRKVYTFGPTFRAEKSKTRRHLIEFWMVEPEVAFADLDDIMQLGEDFIVEIVGRSLETYRDLLEGELERDVSQLEKVEPDPDDPAYSLSVDMLAPEGYGEIIGGGQRASDLGLLKKRIKEHGLPEKAFEWYLDLRRYGTFPHAGFGLGVERTLAWICGIQHVRETIPFPRLINRLSP
jgi:asparaginyl-tRNA synthetase